MRVLRCEIEIPIAPEINTQQNCVKEGVDGEKRCSVTAYRRRKITKVTILSFGCAFNKEVNNRTARQTMVKEKSEGIKMS